MISHSMSLEDNKCKIVFDMTPKDVKCSRSNYTATHKGGDGTRDRYNIWEGVELVEAEIKVGDGEWVSYDTNRSPSVTVNDNGITVQARGLYSIKTMGYHHLCTDGTYPFFYYGNYSNRLNKYSYGDFTDSTPVKPKNNLWSIYALVPKDWDFHAVYWSDWAYIHGQNTSNWAHDSGKFEQRNANYESARNNNGWISDDGLKQISRKSCAFYFRKYYYDSVVSSGIVKEAEAPELTVYPAKGNSGQVKLTYKDKYGAGGRFWLRAYCGGKQTDIDNYDSSGLFHNDESWTYTVNFDNAFGTQYRGNDVYYEGWVRNEYGKESPGTGRKGVQRYNAPPTTPTGLEISSKNNIIYDEFTLTWTPSTDPDGDSITYEVWVRTTDEFGNRFKDSVVNNNVTGTNLNYNISSDPDGCTYEVWVRANDGLLYSDWSQSISFLKGSKPKSNLSLISPSVPNNNLYARTPRFIFYGYEINTIAVVNINGKEYSSDKDADNFVIDNTGKKFLFVPNESDIQDGSIKISAYLKNMYGSSKTSDTYSFNRVTGIDNITAKEITKGSLISKLQEYVKDKAKAYNQTLNFNQITAKETKITADIYNELTNNLKAINDSISNIIKSEDKKVIMESSPVDTNTINKESYWDAILHDINTI